MAGDWIHERADAMSQPTYFELLRDPRWQRKRLEVMEEARFHCQECFVGDRTLNVHHRHYVKGRKPWEYEVRELACLCEACHEARTAVDGAIREAVGRLSLADAQRLLGYAKACDLANNAGPDFDGPIQFGTYEEAMGIADAYRPDCSARDQPRLADAICEATDGDLVAHSTLVAVSREYEPRPVTNG